MPRRMSWLPALALALVCACGLARAGEIVILQPASGVENRNEQAAQRNSDRARRQAGQAVPETVTVTDPTGMGILVPVAPSAQEQARQSARDYLDPPSAGATGEGSTVILRAAPLTETERLRLKARGYAAEPAKSAARNCASTANQVGTIGEGAGAQKSENVIERGGAAVNSNCR